MASISAIVALALSVCAAGAETSVKEIAARVELHPIQSLTIPDKQFLTGDPRGQEATVAGEFRIAQGSGRLPVVILMHGSSGVGANIEPTRDSASVLRPESGGGRVRPAELNTRRFSP